MSKRKYGKAKSECKLCGNHERVLRSYGLHICGRCFREVAKQIGFKKYE